MPTFRVRGRRAVADDARCVVSDTLDARHHARLDELRTDRLERLPALQEEKRGIKKQLRGNCLSLDTRLDLEDRLVVLRREVAELKSARNSYLLQNAASVFDYFERKKQIDEGQGKTTILDTFFKTQRAQSDTASAADARTSPVDADTCPGCRVGELVVVECEGALVCSACARSFPYLVENDKPSYKEPPKEVCFYAYKRINHFREILAQFQAKETTQIPPEVLEAVRNQIKKERIGLEQLTNKKAKEILKKLGYNKYYEHIPFIKDKLGIKPPIMNPELEDTLCRLFMEIQAPYAKFCPDHRVNFLNYYYTVYKLCELLQQNQFLPFFPMLKDREKRIEQDDIWKKICKELDWEFIPTI